MKKRRELDALVNGAKGSKTSRHELLRNESDSSEVEEFAVQQKSVVRKRVQSQCCSTCLAMCGTFLLIICTVSIGCLFWMVIQLKSDLSELHNRLSVVEMGAKNIQAKLNELTASEGQLSTKVDSLTSAESGMPKLQTSVSEYNKRLVLVNSTLFQLAETVKTLQNDPLSTGLIGVEDQMDKLDKTVADMGSSLQSLRQKQLTVDQELGDLKTGLKALQVANDNLQTTPLKNDALAVVQQKLIEFSNDLMAVNETLSQKCENLNELIRAQDVNLQDVRKWMLQFKNQDSILTTNDLQEINSTVKFEVEQYLSGKLLQTDTSLQVERLQHRVNLLEIGEFNLTTSLFDLAASLELFNQTLGVILSRDQLNVTARSLMDRLQRVEEAVDNFETLVQPAVVPSKNVASDADASRSTGSGTLTTPVQSASTQFENHQSQDASSEGENHQSQVASSQFENHQIQDASNQVENHQIQDASNQVENHQIQDASNQVDNHQIQDASNQVENHQIQDTSNQVENHQIQDASNQVENHQIQDASNQVENHQIQDTSSRVQDGQGQFSY